MTHLALQLRHTLSKLRLCGLSQLRVEAVREAPRPGLLVLVLHQGANKHTQADRGATLAVKAAPPMVHTGSVCDAPRGTKNM